VRAEAWETDAIKEFLYNAKQAEAGQGHHYSGALQCFCDAERATGHGTDEVYSVASGGLEWSGPLCEEYFGDKLWSFVYGQSISFLIIGVNYFLKVVTIAAVRWVGQPTVAAEMLQITVGVFVAQFLNTGVLILLINANLSDRFEGAGHAARLSGLRLGRALRQAAARHRIHAEPVHVPPAHHGRLQGALLGRSL
jgi:hypothetical protein